MSEHPTADSSKTSTVSASKNSDAEEKIFVDPHVGAWKKFANCDHVRIRTLRPGAPNGRSPIKGEYVVVRTKGIYLTGRRQGEVFFITGEDHPFIFRLGDDFWLYAIPEVVMTMRKGEICEVIAPDYLVWDGDNCKVEIELTYFFRYDVSPQNDFSAVVNIFQSDGVPGPCPQRGYTCTIEIKGFQSSNLFDDRIVTYTLGQNQSVKIPPGVDRAISYLPLNTIAFILVRGPNTLPPEDCEYFKISRALALEYSVIVLAFEHFGSIQSLWSFDKQMKHIDAGKRKANTLLVNCELEIAAEMYTRLLVELSLVLVENKHQRSQVARRKVAMALNIGLANMYSGLNGRAIACYETALSIDPKNVKALFRKAEIHRMLGYHTDALEALRLLKEVNPNHPYVDHRIAWCEHQLYLIRLRRLLHFDNMFLPICSKKERSTPSTPSTIEPSDEESQSSKKRKRDKKKSTKQ